MYILLQVTQRWTVPAAAGPGPLDLSTVAHSYSSTVDPVNDFYSGLFGMSMVAAKGALLPDGLVRPTLTLHLTLIAHRLLILTLTTTMSLAITLSLILAAASACTMPIFAKCACLRSPCGGLLAHRTAFAVASVDPCCHLLDIMVCTHVHAPGVTRPGRSRAHVLALSSGKHHWPALLLRHRWTAWTWSCRCCLS